MAGSVSAIVDPYTALAAEFADALTGEIGDERGRLREYGMEAEALLRMGRMRQTIGRHKAARSALEAAAKAEPQYPVAWYNLGLVRLFGRANAGAREALEHALDQAPGDFRAELALGLACYHLRDYAAAEGHLRRLAGSTGLRAAARSMLACTQRMQGSWDDARIELGFLKQAKPGDWPALAQQCLDCVERGEQKRQGLLRKKRRAGQMWRALAAAGAGGVWLIYGLAENLFRSEKQWALLPLLGVVLLLVRSLRGISGRELPGEFGNAEQGLPCWQATTWLRPRQSEF
jgi:tetratricopeptide (TPR) repeat protein